MAPSDNQPRLRILFIAGGLGNGGAEKQFIYMLRSLKALDADIRVLSLTDGETHEHGIIAAGVRPVSIARLTPLRRITAIVQAAREFQPHFIQSTHFFSSFYAGLAGRITRTPSIGAVRGDFHHDMAKVGPMSRLLIRLPSVLLANSYNARSNALVMGMAPQRVHVLQNVIDLVEFDRLRTKSQNGSVFADSREITCRAITVARLVPVKRLERFLHALALARQQNQGLQGVIVGSGPEETGLRELANTLHLHPDAPNAGVIFLGERHDVPHLLDQADMYVLTSDREGFPNVILEAMAASQPIVSTPAGDTPELVEEGKTGFIVPTQDVLALSIRMTALAQSKELRERLGTAGRQRVEQLYEYARLGESMMRVYHEIANQVHNRSTLALIEENLQAIEHQTASALYTTSQS